MLANPIQNDPAGGHPCGITLAILAGGEGSRMGRPKGLLEIDARSILEWMLERISWPGGTLLVTAPGRERPPGWERFDAEVCDAIPGQGPMRGILTALESGRTDLAIVMPLDMPLMGREQLTWLAGQKCDRGVLLRRRRDGRQQIEPMPLLIRKSASGVLNSCLRQGRSSVRGLASEAGFSVVDVPVRWDDRVWTNLNSPGDLASFRAMEK